VLLSSLDAYLNHIRICCYVKNSDNFVGWRKLVNRVRFRPAGRGEFLSLKTGRDPLAVWSVGRVSPSDLFVTPNGSFNKNYTAGSVDEKINNVRYRMRLVDPEHPELTPLFVDSVLGIKTIQAMYSGKEPKNLLDTDGGFEQIRLSAKTFEKVRLSRLVWLCMTSSRMQMDNAKTKGYFALLPRLFHPHC
jgi:hypothetical protein